MRLIRINKNPDRRQLVVFAVAWLAVLSLTGAVSWHRGRLAAAEIAWVSAAAVPLAGAAIPGLLRRIYVWLSYAAYPVGLAVSHVVLALVYYLALTPIGLTMRLFRHDPLGRRFEPKARTYWTTRGAAKHAEDYFRQG